MLLYFAFIPFILLAIWLIYYILYERATDYRSSVKWNVH
jgi:hypothetical protein